MSGAAPTPEAGPPVDLADLEADAARLETPAGPEVDTAAAAQAAHAAALQSQAADVVDIAAAIVLPFVPERYAVRYGPPQLEAIGKALGRLAVARGWDVGAVVESFGPELMLAAALLGPVLPVLQEDRKRAKEADESHQLTPPPEHRPPPQPAQVADPGRVL